MIFFPVYNFRIRDNPFRYLSDDIESRSRSRILKEIKKELEGNARSALINAIIPKNGGIVRINGLYRL